MSNTEISRRGFFRVAANTALHTGACATVASATGVGAILALSEVGKVEGPVIPRPTVNHQQNETSKIEAIATCSALTTAAASYTSFAFDAIRDRPSRRRLLITFAAVAATSTAVWSNRFNQPLESARNDITADTIKGGTLIAGAIGIGSGAIAGIAQTGIEGARKISSLVTGASKSPDQSGPE